MVADVFRVILMHSQRKHREVFILDPMNVSTPRFCFPLHPHIAHPARNPTLAREKTPKPSVLQTNQKQELQRDMDEEKQPEKKLDLVDVWRTGLCEFVPHRG